MPRRRPAAAAPPAGAAPGAFAGGAARATLSLRMAMGCCGALKLGGGEVQEASGDMSNSALLWQVLDQPVGQPPRCGLRPGVGLAGVLMGLGRAPAVVVVVVVVVVPLLLLTPAAAPMGGSWSGWPPAPQSTLPLRLRLMPAPQSGLLQPLLLLLLLPAAAACC
jgi:hypothetical protein